MIHIVIGTKAQLIKMAPVMREFKNRGIDYNYISTGQHKETIDDILDNFGIKSPDIELYSGKEISSLFPMLFWSLRILFVSYRKRKLIFRNDKNGIVLVHGDTLSTVLGALMGKSCRLKVAHVESGLRSFSIFQPFPEEIFRRITFILSDIMFCPGIHAVENLKKIRGIKINTFQNTLLDSLYLADTAIENVDGVEIPGRPFAIVTLHRFENVKTKKNLKKIVDLLESVSEKIMLIFILHQITEKKLIYFGLMERLRNNKNIEMRKRYDYFRFIKLMKRSEFVISDGGSNQEECSYLGKPVILFRNVTERNEGLGKNAVLSMFDPGIIAKFLTEYKTLESVSASSEKKPSEIIADYCNDFI